MNDAMVPFHASSKLQFKVNPLRRFLSVEMEIAGLNPGPKEEMFATPLNLDVETLPINLVVERWKGSIVNDVSLPKLGFEINTAPANGDLFVEQVTEICETLRQFGATCTNNYDADKRVLPCGLHTHVDARDLTYNDLQRFLLLYEKVEPALFEMLPGTRRHSHFTIPVGKRYGIMVRAGAPIKPKDREKLGSNPVKTSIIRATYNKKLAARGDKRGCPQETRYGAINIHAWFYRGTIEFRHFYGTVVAREIISWATLVGTLVDFAARSANSTIVGLTDPQLSSGEVLLQIARSSKIELAAFVKHQWAKFKADTDTHESPVLGRNPADDDAARIALEAMRAQVARVPRARPRPRIR